MTTDRRYREESKSPERWSAGRTRGRETTRSSISTGPVTRTQSANIGHRVNTDQTQVTRSSSASRPGSALSGSMTSLVRSPSYRILGGRLVDSMTSKDSGSSWKDENPVVSATTTDQSATMNILR